MPGPGVGTSPDRRVLRDELDHRACSRTRTLLHSDSASRARQQTLAHHGGLGAVTASPRVHVREMQLDEVGIRIGYFHDASDDHLRLLGVDRGLLPTREAWRTFYEDDYARSIRERVNYSLIWELDGEVVGFSSTDQITFGKQAFMHLHILDPTRRHSGLGTQFVKESAATYLRVLELHRLFCQPNALNVAPNRTLQRAGFRYLLSEHTTPSAINFPQVVTRWVIERPA
jgi:RimJ/RimL family protein N-acetyltransferase